jgi:hypothetical protein
MKRTLHVFFFGDTNPTPFDNVDTVNMDPGINSWILKYTNGLEDTIISRENIKFMHSVLSKIPQPHPYSDEALDAAVNDVNTEVEDAEVNDEVIMLPPRKRKGDSV